MLFFVAHPFLCAAVAVCALMCGAVLGGANLERRLPKAALVALFVVAAGAALRAWDIDFGFPALYHPDEVKKSNVLASMFRDGTANPRYFQHPSLLLYLSSAVSMILHWLGVEPESDKLRYVLAGRLVSAAAGSFSIWLVFRLGSVLRDSWVGVAAALLFAVLPLHVTCSRYMKEDALLTAAVLGVALASAHALKERSPRWLSLAVFLSGAAWGSKYSGILAAALPASVPFLLHERFKPDAQLLRRFILSLPLIAAGFLMTTPYALLDTPSFLHGVLFEKSHLLSGHNGIQIYGWKQWFSYHLAQSIIPGMTLAAALAGIGGFGRLLRVWDRELLLLSVGAAVFYFAAELAPLKPMPQPERYILPCLPFLALAAADFASRFRLGSLIAALCIVLPLSQSLLLAAELRPDTRELAGAWMKENIPRGSKVMVLALPNYAPRLSPSRFRISQRSIESYGGQLSPEAIKQEGADFLVLSSLSFGRYVSQPHAQTALREFFNSGVNKAFPLLKEFSARGGTSGFNNPRVLLYQVR